MAIKGDGRGGMERAGGEGIFRSTVKIQRVKSVSFNGHEMKTLINARKNFKSA